MAPHNDRLREEFERRLGRRSAMAHRANAPRRGQAKVDARTASSGRRGNRARIQSGTSKASSDSKKAYKKQFGKKSVNSFRETMREIVDDTIREINTKMATEAAVMEAVKNPPVGDSDPGLWDKGVNFMRNISPVHNTLLGGKPGLDRNMESIVESATGETGGSTTPWQGIMEDFSNSPAGRAMDIVSRPMYGLSEGLQDVVEGTAAREDAGQDTGIWDQLKEFGSGFGQGLTGEEKTGFGQVYESQKNVGNDWLSQAMRDLEESHPALEQNIARGVGFAGEVGLDPTNYVGIGAMPIVRSTGAQLTEATGKSAVRNIVDNAVRNFYDNTVSGTGGLANKPSQDAMAEFAAQAAEDSIENSIIDITAGTHAGWGKMGGEQAAQATSQRVTAQVRNDLFRGFDRRIDDIIEKVQSGKGPHVNVVQTNMAMSPEIKNVIEKAWDEVENHPTNPRSYNNINEFIKDLPNHADSVPLLKRLAGEERSALDAEIIQQVTDEVYRSTRQLHYNTVGIRVGKTRIPIKTIGKAYEHVKKAAPAPIRKNVESFAENMSYEHMAPGRLSIITQQGRSIGAKTFEDFHAKWRDVAKNFTKEDAKLVYKALEDPNAYALTPELQQLANDIRKELDEIHAVESANGARPEKDIYADDYVPVFTKGGKHEGRTSFKNERKQWIKKNRNAGKRYNATAAAREGLKPVDDIFEALLLRKLKSTRDLARASLYKDLIENYGSMSKPMSEFAQKKMGLRKANINHLPQYMRDIMKKDGVEYYLPDSHQKMFDTYSDLGKWNANVDGIIKTWQKTTNIIKYFSTVPRLGFHVRNFVGDLFMGLMDGVPGHTYGEVFQKYLRNNKGGNPGFRITDNLTLSFDEVKELYDRHANSGFFETELPLGGSTPTAGQHLSNTKTRVGQKMRDISDKREDFGRFVHFVAALRQEGSQFAKRGVKDRAKLIEKATESAVWRVNHYKFDYGALTAFERKVKLAFPFYTFARKAMPTMIQQLALHPKYLGLTSRFMEYNDGSAQDNFNSFFLPDYVKDMGYGMISGGDEPLYMTQDVLPTSVMNNLDFTNSQEFFQSVGQQANPLAQIPFEMALGKQVFSGRPTGSFPEYMLNKFSIPGQLGENTGFIGENQDPGWLQVINESFTGAGIPLRQFTEEQQDYGLRAAEDRFIQDPFSDFNRSQDQYRIYQSNKQSGTTFVIEDVASGQIVGEGTNPSQLLQKAKQLAGG